MTVSSVAVPASAPVSRSVGAGAVMLIGIWLGLLTGLCDVAFLVMIKKWIDRDFYRLGADFPWIVPLGVTVVILVPTLIIAAIAQEAGVGATVRACGVAFIYWILRAE